MAIAKEQLRQISAVIKNMIDFAFYYRSTISPATTLFCYQLSHFDISWYLFLLSVFAICYQQIKDPRNQSFMTFGVEELLYMVILKNACSIHHGKAEDE